MTHQIILKGKIPSKKNNWKPGKHGGIYCAKNTELDALLFQVRSQWKAEPLKQVSVMATFEVAELRSDLDNMYTTVQDLLVKGGVLANDNLKVIQDFRAYAKKAGANVTTVYLQEVAV